MEILDIVSRHASVTFQNVQLINELKAKAYESEQYKKEIIRTREEERKRISHELHDQVIQALIGLKYQISHLRSSQKSMLRHSQKLFEKRLLYKKK
ncbi:MAG: histidine kinase [Chloroflexi bacterium]|nr:histidine kinase [Chloroflexota bacterium]